MIVTVCIAAACAEASKVVVAADRMVTGGLLPIEFEHGTRKIDEVTPYCIALSAGDALVHTELLRTVRAGLLESSTTSITQIGEMTAEMYAAARRRTVEERYLRPRGLTMEQFYANINTWPTEMAAMIDGTICTFDYNLELLLAGVDEQGAHISAIRNPGIALCYDAIGYHATGMGQSHAVLRLIADRVTPTSDLNMVVYSVYEAKRAAEVAPGVGKDTDMAIVSTDSGISYLDDEQLECLDSVYRRHYQPSLKEVERLVAELDFEPQGGSDA